MSRRIPENRTLPLFSKGQRWISTAEPELGLGTVTLVANRRVEINYSTHATTRVYSLEDAPLQRIIFSPGNSIEDTNGNRYNVVAVEPDPATGLVTYRCSSATLPEDALADTIAFSTPQQRLSAGIADGITDFTFRGEMVRHHAAIGSSPVRGFVGGRIDLIPHQLYIADRATARADVRVLLADETGLGKTIEACLILHRLLIVGQVTRACMLVPDALVHQWFVELLRRFNITCRLCSEEQLDEEEDNARWFNDDPLWICSTATLCSHTDILRQLSASPWDLVIVDEAHHIAVRDPLFAVLEDLARKNPSMILLSATPEQFGRNGHFARLGLLDPHRYGSPETYGNEVRRLKTVSRYIEQQLGRQDSAVSIDTAIPLNDEMRGMLMRSGNLTSAEDITLPATFTIAQLIDIFGVGRAYVRNTRHTIPGFPKRIASMVALPPVTGDTLDPRTVWIADFLKKHPRRKVLVITSTIASAAGVRDTLQKIMPIDVALFHESMTLLQRDRQAAWFAEEHGPRVLVCSESGSEGRNFQFCSDLVLLDLPWNPELLEQRIGRLDRIGQKHTIQIHLPVIAGSSEEVLCRWYHEGVGAFEHNVPAAGMVFEEVRSRLRTLAVPVPGENHAPEAIDALLDETRTRTAELTDELFAHRDFLLEYASNNLPKALQLIDAIEKASAENRTFHIMEQLFKHFGVKMEEAGNKRLALNTELCTDHAFPLPRAERPVITFDRKTACSHDTVEFLTIDHPMVTGALDLYLSSPHGTTSFALWNDPAVSELLLESLYLIECIAPANLRLFRFFNRQPLRMVVNHHRQLVTDRYPAEMLDKHLKNGPVAKLVAQKQLIEVTFPLLHEASERFAAGQIVPEINRVKKAVRESYANERERLTTLQSLGAAVAPAELDSLSVEETSILTHLSAARVRCDAVRLIWRGAVRGE